MRKTNSTPEEKKAQILAWSKLKKPSIRAKTNKEKVLARALYNYTIKSSTTYDPDFDSLIRKKKPSWFVKTASEKKRKLLKWSSKNRPKQISSDLEEQALGRALSRYTIKSAPTYDPDFDALIRKKKPLWFVDKVADKKRLLLKWPKRKKKPSQYSKEREEMVMGRALSCYTKKSSGSYDPQFTKAIYKTHRDWFAHWTKKDLKKHKIT